MDIIALIFLSREIWKLALIKGLKPSTWVLYLASSWIFLELIGILLGLMLFGKDNLVSVGLLAIAFAITSYFIISAQLKKMPDRIDDNQ